MKRNGWPAAIMVVGSWSRGGGRRRRQTVCAIWPRCKQRDWCVFVCDRSATMRRDALADDVWRMLVAERNAANVVVLCVRVFLIGFMYACLILTP